MNAAPMNSPNTAVGKLLLNAWSAEYALKIIPSIHDTEYLNHSLDWVFPQAYYAAIFSVRAVLLTNGIHEANPERLEQHIAQWVQNGAYGLTGQQPSNPFADLLTYNLKSHFPRPYMNGPEVAGIHRKLMSDVQAIASIHETHIQRKFGASAYQEIVEGIPDYLRNAFVGVRTVLLPYKRVYQPLYC